MKINFKYDYKTISQVRSLTTNELIAYKKAMEVQATNLKDEAAMWNITRKLVSNEINDRYYDLQCMEVEAELDRVESDGSDYGSIGFIH